MMEEPRDMRTTTTTMNHVVATTGDYHDVTTMDATLKQTVSTLFRRNGEHGLSSQSKMKQRFSFERQSTSTSKVGSVSDGERMVALSVLLEDDDQLSTTKQLDGQKFVQKQQQKLQNIKNQLGALLESDDISVESQLIASERKLVITVPESQMLSAAQSLSHHLDVHWIEPLTERTVLNKWGRGITQTGKADVEPLKLSELRGQGQLVAVCDSGLDYNSCYFHDSENRVSVVRNVGEPKKSTPHRKIHEIWALIDDVSEGRAHGTHVAGSVLGSPMKQLNSSQYVKFDEHSGMAPEAKVLFTDIGCIDENGCSCHGVPCVCDLMPGGKCKPSERAVFPPLDLNSGLFPYSYESGARIHTNSWGGGSGWGYGLSSMEIDTFAWQHKDFVILFAAGNSGDVEGYGSLGIEAESKNAITVGATMNSLGMFQFAAEHDDYEERAQYISSLVLARYNCDFNGCQNFTVEQEATCNFWRNFTAKDCCSTAGVCASKGCGCGAFNVGAFCCKTCAVRNLETNIFSTFEYSPENAAYFSSRGPTTDLRIKPDVCAPGHSVVSANSFNTAKNPQVCTSGSQFDPTKDITKMGGTSMATPITAGNAALVRQYYLDGYHVNGVKNPSQGFNPSSALVKATLINSGRPLQGFIEMAETLVPIRPGESSDIFVNPKLIEGHGRVTLMDTLSFASTDLKTAQKLLLGRVANVRSAKSVKEEFGDPLFENGDAHEYCFTVGQQSSSRSLKATLVWTDYPSSPVNQVHLINNLDLLLKDSKGQTWNGNMPQGSTLRDTLNNVEQVIIEKAATGNYMIRIEGSIVKGPQPYALVISGENVEFRSCGVLDVFPTSTTGASTSTIRMVLVGGGVVIALLLATVGVLGFVLYRTYRKNQEFLSKGVRLDDAQEMATTTTTNS